MYRVNENDATSQCKYDQKLTSVGLDHKYLRYKTKIKPPLNIFEPWIVRVKYLCCFKVMIGLHLKYIDAIQQIIFNYKGSIGLLMLLFKNYTKGILKTK